MKEHTEWTEKSPAELSTHLDACGHLASSILSLEKSEKKTPFHMFHSNKSVHTIAPNRNRHSPSK